MVYEEDRLKVLHYVSETKPRHRTPLVFVYALVNRPYILDLKKGRSVVANFVDRGFDTYLVDWGVPTDADRYLTLDDYINGYLVNVMDYLCERTGVKQVERPRLLHGRHDERDVHLAASGARQEPDPFWPRPLTSPRAMACSIVWTQSEYFDVDKFVDAFGNCPAGVSPGFVSIASSCAKPDPEAH